MICHLSCFWTDKREVPRFNYFKFLGFTDVTGSRTVDSPVLIFKVVVLHNPVEIKINAVSMCLGTPSIHLGLHLGQINFGRLTNPCLDLTLVFLVSGMHW